MLQELYIEYAFSRLRVLDEVYNRLNDAKIQQKVKAKMDTTADLWIKAKISISEFIQECKDFDAYNACWPQTIHLRISRPQNRRTTHDPFSQPGPPFE